MILTQGTPEALIAKLNRDLQFLRNRRQVALTAKIVALIDKEIRKTQKQITDLERNMND